MALQLFVKTTNNSTLVLQANPNDSIEELKESITRRTNIPTHQQKLCYGYKLLQDDSLPLKAYNIRDSCVLNLIVSFSFKHTELNSPTYIPNIESFIRLAASNKLASSDELDVFVCNPTNTLHEIFTNDNLESDQNTDKLQSTVVHMFGNTQTLSMSVINFNEDMHSYPPRTLNDTQIHDMQLLDVDPSIRYSSLIVLRQQMPKLSPIILVPNTTISKTEKLSTIDIARQILKYLSTLNHKTDRRMRPTLHAICKLAKLETMCEAFIQFGIPNVFDTLINPHTESTTLLVLSKLYYRFCQVKDVLDISYNVQQDEHDEKSVNNEERNEQRWRIFKHLKLMLFYEDDMRVVNYALAAMWNLIVNSANSDREIQVIVSDIFSTELETIYRKKFHHTKLIFSGYLRSSAVTLNTEFVPTDISAILYAYYNCYENMKVNYMERLFSFFGKNTGYRPRIKEMALMCLQRTVQFSSEHTAYELHALYDLVKHCKLILQDEYITDDTFWIVQNLHTNLLCVKQSNVVELMLGRFAMMVKEEIAMPKLNVTLKIVLPFICTLQHVTSAEKLTTLLMDYALMESMMVLMKKMLSDEQQMLADEGVEEAVSKILELLQYLLSIEVVGDICVQQVEVHGGLTILKEIANEMYDVSYSSRAQGIVATYFQQNN